MNKRIYIEKKEAFDSHSLALLKELKDIVSLENVKIYQIYDLLDTTQEVLENALYTIFTDPVTEIAHVENKPKLHVNSQEFAIEFLPGQYDQRADSAEQCLNLLGKTQNTKVRSGQLIQLVGLVESDLEKVKKYCINKVEARVKNLTILEIPAYNKPQEVEFINNFIGFSSSELEHFFANFGFAMGLDDLTFVQEHFKSIHRNPTETELKVLDTYWSDHCRHTTFLTEITDVQFSGDFKTTLERIFNDYLGLRKDLNRTHKPITLMDLATVAAKYLHKNGKLQDLVITDEINACTIEIEVDVNGKIEPWYLLFKNETHNHPTEIEPFGGASTCIGGAIRDPLSGRAYVYQAMRVTGAANPLEAIEDTLDGKLPQKKITQGAASGYSAYGNQIGLATSHVSEIYDEGYKAKRMEVGMVVGAVPKVWVRRETPSKGDVILLIGGETGRDGVGGATGSSKVHDVNSIEDMSAEVQKGNPVVERKIQRLFRNPSVTKLIKKCNDFGAGGVSVAIGELADGLTVDLDKIAVKYQGLNGTELAISESQERMAIVIDAKDVAEMVQLVAVENMHASHVATVTDDDRLTMLWQGKEIVSLSRAFLDSNGVSKKTTISSSISKENNPFVAKEFSKEALLNQLKSLESCSQKGLIENFDASIGASTILMPLGGKTQLTPAEGSVHLLPVLGGETTTVSMATWGFSPAISKWSTLHGGAYAVVESVAKMVALGGDYTKIRFSFQEYFQKLGTDPIKWALPFNALLGALDAQMAFGLAAIGGKDSMSGSFNELHVPPTLISFACATGKANHIISPEFKKAGNKIYLFKHQPQADGMPNFQQLKEIYTKIHQAILAKKITAIKIIKDGGLATALTQMCIGNDLGANILTEESLLQLSIGDLVFETSETWTNFILLGEVTETPTLNINDIKFEIEELKTALLETLEPVFATKVQGSKSKVGGLKLKVKSLKPSTLNLQLSTKPIVCLPIFPGTNCEYDTKQAFQKEGATVNDFVFRNLNLQNIEESIFIFEKQLKDSQILMLSGGFSAGDEPAGSAKFIATILRNPRISDAIHELLERNGLILGICNGFQALIKSGLLPYGKIRTLTESSPTLINNQIGRHISQMVNVKVCNTNSPWLSGVQDQIYTIPVSHGEGKFIANEQIYNELIANGQIATHYVDNFGNTTLEMPYNPNGSMYGVEGITSKDGKIFGRMGHPERFKEGLFKNIPTANYHNIFRNGIEYFK